MCAMHVWLDSVSLLTGVLNFQILKRSLVRDTSGLMSSVIYWTIKPFHRLIRSDLTVSSCSAFLFSYYKSHLRKVRGPAAVSSQQPSTCFPSQQSPTMFFINSTVCQSRTTTRTKQHRFKPLKKLNKTHLSGGNHHNLLEIIKCHFVATRCGPRTAHERRAPRSVRTGRGAENTWATSCSAPPNVRTRTPQRQKHFL